MAFHRLGQTRQVIQWSQVTETLGDCVLVPISPAVFHVACKLLAERGLWPSTFAIDTPKNVGYNSPDVTSAEWLSYKAEVADFIADGQEFMTKFTDLLTTNLMIVSALTGDTIDRDHPENHLTGEYATDGLRPVIETGFENNVGAFNTQTDFIIAELQDIEAQLLSIAETIASGGSGNLEDELEGIQSTISTIGTILGVLAV